MSGCRAWVDEAVRALFDGQPRWKFFVPGRLEVFGKHTDYAGGRSLVGAVPRGFTVAAIPADDGMVSVVDARSGARFDCPAAVRRGGAARWQHYVSTVVSRLAANFPEVNLSARIVFCSDLPPASGISSSSALIVAIAEVLVARSGIAETERWRLAVRGIEDRAAYFGCIENGASFRGLAGDEGVGTHGGSEDHAAILSSRRGRLHMFAFCPLRLLRAVSIPDGWTFVVVSSGVRASKTGGAQAAYNHLADEAAALARWVRERADHEAPPAEAVTLGDLARAGALEGVVVPPHWRPRLEHFLAEDARVAAAADALRDGDLARLGELAARSHRDAARLLGNQVSETHELVASACELGAAAASSFGAGWGGSVWALVRCADADAFLAAWLRGYRARYPSHPSDGFVSPPSEGLHACS